MKKLLSIFLIMIVISMTVSLAACGGDSDADNTDNGDDNNIAAVSLVMGELAYNDITKTVSWDKVENASGYKLFIGYSQKTGVTTSGNKMQYTIEESTSGILMVSVIALGDGENYTDSETKMKNINYTVAKQPPANKLVIYSISATRDEENGELDRITWYSEWWNNSTVYRVFIKDSDGAVIDLYDMEDMGSKNVLHYTANYGYINISDLDFSKIGANGSIEVIAKGDGVDTSDSDTAVFHLNAVYRELNEKTARAFELWLGDFNIYNSGFIGKVGATLRTDDFEPRIYLFYGVDISDAEAPSKSVVTVFFECSLSGIYCDGRVSYEIDAVEGDSTIDRLNDVADKIDSENIIESSFTETAHSIYVLRILKRENYAPIEIKNCESIIFERSFSMTKSSDNVYNVKFGGLLDMGNGEYMDVVYDGQLKDASSLTIIDVCSRISNGGGTITLNSSKIYTGMAEYMEILQIYLEYAFAN